MPQVEMTLSDAKEHQKVLQTGVKAARGYSVYARTSDRPQLFLLSSYSVDDVAKKKADDLRDKTVLAFDPNTITRLSLQTSAQTVRVEKQGKSSARSGKEKTGTREAGGWQIIDRKSVV